MRWATLGLKPTSINRPLQMRGPVFLTEVIGPDGQLDGWGWAGMYDFRSEPVGLFPQLPRPCEDRFLNCALGAHADRTAFGLQRQL